MTPHLLIADDEELIRWALDEHFRGLGYRTTVVADGRAALDALIADKPDVVLLDLKMPVLDGLGVLSAVRERSLDVPIVMLTAYGGLESAVEATKRGAERYLSKPFDLDEVARVLEEVRAEHARRQEVVFLQQQERGGHPGFVGAAPSLAPVFATLDRILTVDAPTVLILGESGTGKDVIARLIHQRGLRQEGPFMDIDCAALPETLIESELFGHEKGAFTDARATKQGLFEVASGGVVFLDELGEMPLATQAKLLRALETRTFRRVGGVASLPMDVQLIAATNRNLADEVKAGRFREDLYFRLHVVPILLPALRERRADVPLLASFFLARFNKAFHKRIRGFSAEAIEKLSSWRWPGNVRELRNTIERIVLMTDHEVIGADALPAEIRWAEGGDPVVGCPFRLPDGGVDLDAVERGLLAQASERAVGDLDAIAGLVGLSVEETTRRLERHGLR